MAEHYQRLSEIFTKCIFLRAMTTIGLALALCFPWRASACSMIYGNGWQGCAEAVERQAVWYDRWGAVATDKSNGAFGAADTVATRKKAISKAVKLCRKNKGVDCQIRLVYRNECASMVSGQHWDIFHTAASREEAISIASSRCQQKDNGCKVVYAACSEGVSR